MPATSSQATQKPVGWRNASNAMPAAPAPHSATQNSGGDTIPAARPAISSRLAHCRMAVSVRRAANITQRYASKR